MPCKPYALYTLSMYHSPVHRSPTSHKGENGIVMIIGGSEPIHGAPLFSALAAEASGVDLIYVSLPQVHADVARMTSLNFLVHPFPGNDLSAKYVEPLSEMLATMDCVVIGPGLARDKASLAHLKALIESCSCPMVLDASALQPWTLDAVEGKKAVLTPHLGELERMELSLEDIAEASNKYKQVIHVKGATDVIAMPDGTVEEVSGGNAGLTVGGTGDALAGLIAGLIAQKMSREDASILASKIIKKAGDELFVTQGNAYTTRQVIFQIPGLLKDI